MDALDAILEGLERALALEAELGVRTVECDRALLKPLPAAAPLQAVPGTPQPPAPPASGVRAAAPRGADAREAPDAPPRTPPQTLAALDARIASCTACPLHSTRSRAVPGQGCAVRPQVMFVGDVPGTDDEKSGLAFSGRAGDFFDKMLAAMRLDRSSVFLTTICKCRTPGGAPPPVACQNACLPHLENQIRLVSPRCIVVLTTPASAAVFPARRLRRGQWHVWNGIPAICTLHPSYILRFDSSDGSGLVSAKREIWETLKAVMRFLAQPGSGASAEKPQ